MTVPGHVHAILERTGALLDGHFLLSSGRHSSQYIQCAKALENPADAAELGRALAQRVAADGASRVVSPPLGALLIGYEVARHLGLPFAFPERSDQGQFHFRRGFEIEPGERVIVIEDVITTGRTTQELLKALKEMGVAVVRLGAIVDRSDTPAIGDLLVEALVRLSIPTYAPDACPMCLAGGHPVKPGSRKEREITP